MYHALHAQLLVMQTAPLVRHIIIKVEVPAAQYACRGMDTLTIIHVLPVYLHVLLASLVEQTANHASQALPNIIYFQVIITLLV